MGQVNIPGYPGPIIFQPFLETEADGVDTARLSGLRLTLPDGRTRTYRLTPGDDAVTVTDERGRTLPDERQLLQPDPSTLQLALDVVSSRAFHDEVLPYLQRNHRLKEPLILALSDAKKTAEFHQELMMRPLTPTPF